jgi:hypothetical protein
VRRQLKSEEKENEIHGRVAHPLAFGIAKRAVFDGGE